MSGRESNIPGSSPDDLKYSLYIDNYRKKEPEKLSTLDCVSGQKSVKWIDDDAVKNCQSCKSDFGWFNRKHHCRACGNIFCGKCWGKYIKLPLHLETYPDPSNNVGGIFGPRKYDLSKDEVPVCNSCHTKYSIMNSDEINALIRIFLHLDMKDLATMSKVCSVYKRAANACKTFFRNTQYVIPGHKLSSTQISMLKINSIHFAGHSKYILKLLGIVDWSNPKQVELIKYLLNSPQTCTCWNLMCTSSCNKQISGYEIVEMLNIHILDLDIRRNLVDRLSQIVDSEFECLLPQLVWGLQYEIGDDYTLMNVLISRAVPCRAIRVSLYWNLTYLMEIKPRFREFHKMYLSALDSRIGKDLVIGDLINGKKLVQIIDGLYNHQLNGNFKDYLRTSCNKDSLPIGVDDEKIVATSKHFIPNPVLPNTTLNNFISTSIKFCDTATKPVIVNMNCRDGKIVREQRILYKKECVIKDYVIINIIRMMDQILKRELSIDFGIKTYNCMPTGKDAGLIEFVSRAETLYTIQYIKNFTILNFIQEHNKDKTVGMIRDRFVKSAAAYCVITYLLGIGDRHMDNIMVTEDGYLFHIDYGYILGSDPKFGVLGMTPAMRITKDIIDAMGGLESTGYLEFKAHCKDIYKVLRRYTSLFMSLLSIMTDQNLSLDGGKYTLDLLKNQIFTRFIPSENSDDAEKQIEFKIEDSYKLNKTQVVMDFWHHSVHTTKESASSIVKKFI